jgi:hypothetical protein
MVKSFRKSGWRVFCHYKLNFLQDHKNIEHIRAVQIQVFLRSIGIPLEIDDIEDNESKIAKTLYLTIDRLDKNIKNPLLDEFDLSYRYFNYDKDRQIQKIDRSQANIAIIHNSRINFFIKNMKVATFELPESKDVFTWKKEIWMYMKNTLFFLNIKKSSDELSINELIKHNYKKPIEQRWIFNTWGFLNILKTDDRLLFDYKGNHAITDGLFVDHFLNELSKKLEIKLDHFKPDENNLSLDNPRPNFPYYFYWDITNLLQDDNVKYSNLVEYLIESFNKDIRYVQMIKSKKTNVQLTGGSINPKAKDLKEEIKQSIIGGKEGSDLNSLLLKIFTRVPLFLHNFVSDSTEIKFKGKSFKSIILGDLLISGGFYQTPSVWTQPKVTDQRIGVSFGNIIKEKRRTYLQTSIKSKGTKFLDLIPFLSLRS